MDFDVLRTFLVILHIEREIRYFQRSKNGFLYFNFIKSDIKKKLILLQNFTFFFFFSFLI